MKKKIFLIIIFLLLLFSSFIPLTFTKYYSRMSKTITLNVISVPSAYFCFYDGSDGLFGFDKTNIVSFSRNTTLTKSDVLQKEGVQLISNTEDDGYLSIEEIYGWVENNQFYWWSEAPIVYFHPKTKNAFRWFQKITTIDLTGTSTEKVENFSHWFKSDENLISIIGKINTRGLKIDPDNDFDYYADSTETEDISSETGFSFMFYGCSKLASIDLSEFYTTNCIDMKQMFGSTGLKELDLSGFDTSNVKSMRHMFSRSTKLKELDLRSFNYSSIVNMYKYVTYTKIQTLYLGNLNTVPNNNVSFAGAYLYNDNLRVIYVDDDNDFISNQSGKNVFLSDDLLVGGFGTLYETSFDSNNVGVKYARVSKENQPGYFTYLNENDAYNITYDLDGGIADNRDKYYIGSADFTLNNPIKESKTFIGWTGSNGDTPELDVTIPQGSTGDKHYIANYFDDYDYYYIKGPCTFYGGNSNITGSECRHIRNNEITSYTNNKYIDTGIYLFNNDNINKDFEISFTIDNVSTYENQATIVSSMYEASSPWPGFVFRISTSDSMFLLRAGYNGNANWFVPYTAKDIKIYRQNKKLYYSVDGGTPVQTVDYTNFDSTFNYPVTIGAGLDVNKKPRRYFSGTLSNISIKILS